MSRIQLKNVKISYPSLFSPAVFEGKEGKYEATFLIPKEDEKTKRQIDKLIADALAEAKVKGKIPSDKYCLKDGDEHEDENYHGCWTIKASNAKRPTVINSDKTPLVEEDEVIYAGCKVYAIIDIWIQNNKWGKRVNANLYGVMFYGDDEPFGLGPINVSDDFDDVDIDEEL